MMMLLHELRKFHEKILREIDIFGYDTDLFVLGERKFTTVFGGFLSIIYYAFFLSMFFFLGSNMLNRENPEMTASQIFKANPSASRVGKEDYFFMFGMQYPNYSHFYDPSIYTLKLQDQKKRILNFERCTEDHLPDSEDLSLYFKNAPGSKLSDLICLSLNSTTMISGDFSIYYDYNTIQISISPCQNKTNDQNISVGECKSKEEISKALTNSYFAFYSTDIIIDLLQNDPGRKVGVNYYIETDLTVKKKVVRYLSTSHVVEDVGWIIKEQQEEAFTITDRDKESMSLIKSEDQGKSEILSMVIRKSTYEKLYTRKYLKIQSVLALMGGFLQILYSFIFILSRPIIKKLFHDNISNLIYNFENGNHVANHRGKIAKMKFQIAPNNAENVKPVDTHGSKSMFNFLSNIYNSKDNSITQAFSLEESPLKVTFTEQIMSTFSKNLKMLSKTQQRNKAIEKIQKKLDLVYMLDKYNEIEKIKMLLLNEEQYRLFEFLPKPKIQNDLTINYSPQYSSNSSKQHLHEKSFFFTEDYNKVQKAQKAEESLRKIMSKTQPSDIDLKLISLLSPELKTLLYGEQAEKKDFSPENCSNSDSKPAEGVVHENPVSLVNRENS